MPIFHKPPNVYSKIKKSAQTKSDNSGATSAESLAKRRNDNLRIMIERQVDYDENLKKNLETKMRKASEKQASQQPPKSEKEPISKDRRDREGQNGNEKDVQRVQKANPPPKSKQAQEKTNNEENMPLAPEPEPKLLKSSRIDAIVLIIILAMIMACIAVGLEGHAYSVDFTYWNNLLDGHKIITEVDPNSIMRGKTLDLENHFYLVQAKEYLKRKESQEIIFVLLVMGILLGTAIHLFGYYLKTTDFEDHAATLIGWYAASGAVCIFSGVFLISSAIRIENSYTYAADMFFNFQHYLDNEDPIHNQAACPGDIYVRGCDYYEYARKQAKDLEMIFRLCGSGSRFTHYYEASKVEKQKIYIVGEEFSRKKLKAMGFCSPDGYKYMAAIFAMIAGILFAIVPVVFCCETSSVKKQPFIPELIEEELRRKEGLFDNSGAPVIQDEVREDKKKKVEEEKAKLVEKDVRAEMRKALRESEERKARKSEERRRKSLEEDPKKSEGSKRRSSLEKSKRPPDELIFGWKKYIESDSG